MAAKNPATNPYVPEKYKIMKIFRETHDTFTFRIGMKMKHMPGQFFEIGVLGIGECPISITSYSDKYIDFCIRNVGNVTKAIHSKREGSNVWIRGPYGNGYPMQEMYGRDVCLIGGGTGTAPLRGALQYIDVNRKLFGKVNILFGFRFPHDMMFKRDYAGWKKKFNLYLSVDKVEEGDKSWKGNVGFVASLVEKADIKPDSAVIICGPPMMIKSVMDGLAKKGVKDENVYISFERLMSCGIGKCGHCEIGGKYVCRHGPVFRYDKAKEMAD